MVRVMMAVALMAGMTGLASAKPALRDVPVIDNGLFAVGLAHEIRRNCPDISARFFRALGFLRQLEREAEALGYTEAEVEAHLESDVEKDRLRARAARYMADQGFAQDSAGYCALGRSEIARNSQTGTLLRVSN